MYDVGFYHNIHVLCCGIVFLFVTHEIPTFTVMFRLLYAPHWSIYIYIDSKNHFDERYINSYSVLGGKIMRNTAGITGFQAGFSFEATHWNQYNM